MAYRGLPRRAAPCVAGRHAPRGYIATAPAVRIRESTTENGTEYILCFKGKGTLAREEIETPIDKALFQRLEAFIGRPLVTKAFRAYALPGGETLEVSLVDEGLPTQFFYAEVEFPTVEAARAFTPPQGAGLGREMTEDAGFSMSRYWRRTRLGE